MILQSPFFLWGLLALAIPIIIHLVQLRKPQRILFTNVAFIRNVDNITSNQRKLKNWLILLARILFLFFLVFVFCEPLIPAAEKSSLDLNQVAVYLDNSGSLQNEAEKGGLSLLELGKDEVATISKAFPKQAKVQLVENSFQMASYKNLSPENLPDRLSAIDFTPVSRQTQIIFDRLQLGLSNNSKIFWFSDFQRSTFNPSFLNQIDTVSEVNLVKLNAVGTANVFVDSVSLEDELVRLNQNNRLLIRVYNNGSEEKNAVPIKLYLGNRQAGANSINLKAKSAGSFFIDFRISEPTVQQARLIIDDQPVTFDNTFYFTLTPAKNIRILDITGSVLSITSRLFTNEPIFAYRSLEPNSVTAQDVEKADLVILNEVPQVQQGVADKLNKFVKAGGNLLIIPSAEKNAAGYQELFRSFGLAISTQPGNSLVSQLALPDLKNPFFRNIFAEMDKRMQMPKAFSQLAWPRSDNELLVFKNGNKFLSGFNAGKGTVYLFAAPLVVPENEFSHHALFVPVMYKLALSSHEADQQLAYNFNQRSFSLPVPPTDLRKSVFSFETDSTKFIPEQSLRNGKVIFTLPSEMAEPGFYRLKHSDSVLTTLAFNYPKSESLLDTYSANELRQLIKNKHVKIFESGGNSNFGEIFSQSTKGTPLWPYFLVASLLFLLAEILLIRFL